MDSMSVEHAPDPPAALDACPADGAFPTASQCLSIHKRFVNGHQLPKEAGVLVLEIVFSDEIQRLLRLLKMVMKSPENLRQGQFLG
jgi:hypothetical protein